VRVCQPLGYLLPPFSELLEQACCFFLPWAIRGCVFHCGTGWPRTLGDDHQLGWGLCCIWFAAHFQGTSLQSLSNENSYIQWQVLNKLSFIYNWLWWERGTYLDNYLSMLIFPVGGAPAHLHSVKSQQMTPRQ
jgi:hypothetical protein